MADTRIVTKEQLAEGYMTFANGVITRHAYRVQYQIAEGPYHDCYVVDEPTPEPGAGDE